MKHEYKIGDKIDKLINSHEDMVVFHRKSQLGISMQYVAGADPYNKGSISRAELVAMPLVTLESELHWVDVLAEHLYANLVAYTVGFMWFLVWLLVF